MLNTVLTVRAHQANSHQKRGWEVFTDGVIRTVARERKGVVYLLWGKQAQDKARLVSPAQNLVLQCPHPSVRTPGPPPRPAPSARPAQRPGLVVRAVLMLSCLSAGRARRRAGPVGAQGVLWVQALQPDERVPGEERGRARGLGPEPVRAGGADCCGLVGGDELAAGARRGGRGEKRRMIIIAAGGGSTQRGGAAGAPAIAGDNNPGPDPLGGLLKKVFDAHGRRRRRLETHGRRATIEQFDTRLSPQSDSGRAPAILSPSARGSCTHAATRSAKALLRPQPSSSREAPRRWRASHPCLQRRGQREIQAAGRRLDALRTPHRWRGDPTTGNQKSSLCPLAAEHEDQRSVRVGERGRARTLREGDERLGPGADHEHVVRAGGEHVALRVLDVRNGEGALVLLKVLHHPHTASVAPASDHAELADVELRHVRNLVRGDVKENGVVHLGA